MPMTRISGFLCCTTLALALAGAAQGQPRSRRDRGCRQGVRRRRGVLRRRYRHRAHRQPRLDSVGRCEPDRDPESGRDRELDPQAQAAHTRISSPSRAMDARDMTSSPERCPSSSSSCSTSRGPSPGEGLRRSATSRTSRASGSRSSTRPEGALRSRLRAFPGAVLRRAEGGRPGDHRDRDRPLAARERPPEREEQHLTFAGALPARPRRRLPRQRANEADDGRARLPPVPRARARSGRRRASRGQTRACPISTGSSRRSGMRSTGPRSRPSPSPRRPSPSRSGSTSTRSAGRSGSCLRSRPCYWGTENGPTDGRGDSGADLRRLDQAGGVRPGGASTEFLPPGGRARPEDLAERADPGRRIAPALVRRGQGDDRPDPRRLPAAIATLGPRPGGRLAVRLVGEPAQAR